MDRFLDAALARREAVRAPADRPSQRRNAEAAGSLAVVRFAAVTSLRAKTDATDALEFEGIASATERSYEMWDMFGPYNEIVSASAFDETLNRADLDVPLVLGHDQLRRIARTTNGTLRLDMTDAGLRAQADLDPADVDVAYIVPKLRAGLIDEMSFAFRIDSGHWSPDYTEFRIDKVDMHRGDTAIVGWGANPYTSGGMRSKEQPARRSGEQAIPADALSHAPRF
jgi:HK97 family phage prohead protease